MDRDEWDPEGLPPTQVSQAEPKARIGGEQLGKDKRHDFRRSLARKDDVGKSSATKSIETIHLTTLPFDQAQTVPFPSPGRMSTIPILPGSSESTVTTSPHPRSTPAQTPAPGTTTTAAATRTTPTGRPRFFASGRPPHPGGDRGGPNNFFWTHGRNGGPPRPALPAFAITLIVIGAIFMVFAAIAVIFCCRGTFWSSLANPFPFSNFPLR